MANREITYYSLLSKVELRQIESIADELDEESFIEFGYERKWLSHLWIGANNDAFLEYISYQNDLGKLDRILGEQLKLYARKQGEGFEQDKSNFHGVYKARKDWLNHTIFICKNEYSKSQNEIFNEVVKWCIEWQNEWLETYNPYSPEEREEMSKELKTPLWEQLNENERSGQSENIDWIELFDRLDVENPMKPKAYITSNIEQKKNYFSEASFRLTIQMLTELKKETYLLSHGRKLDYLNSLNIEKPAISNSESPEFNQVVFEARNNYYEFLALYRITLEQTLPITKTKNEKRKPEMETPKTFEELFFHANTVTPCLDILKELDPPFIDVDYNYIGKLKGIIVVWVDELQRQGIVKHFSDRKIFASLIPQRIKRFYIDESMFGKHQKKAEYQYRMDIKTKVSEIKLSQNSQKGELGK